MFQCQKIEFRKSFNSDGSREEGRQNGHFHWLTSKDRGSQRSEVHKPQECALLGFFIAWHCIAKAFLHESMTYCSTGPKLGGILDSANHSGWPYGILSLIAWPWAYCSADTPISKKPILFLQYKQCDFLLTPTDRYLLFLRVSSQTYSVVLVGCQVSH